MTRVTLIAALGRNRIIGRDGTMPWHLPEDLKHFKALTMGHPMVMGRKTFDSIGRPLPGRRSIVITRDREWRVPGVEVAHSFDEALDLAGPADRVFVIGGGEVYAVALPFADHLELTEVDAEPEGDTWFPEWDPAQWREVARDQRDGYAFVSLERAGGRPDPSR
ncbi:MAG TPA: dihydrofolate reductase [Phycicoccus sp.]|jgi:dihydrofolate reductase|nr:dihydrofolate reductase [Phycicoccus sp.]HQY96807.1 dihydrofolate reductase [Phycicoccus sp.]HRA43610.1 dihydrofolate reductase [Phycicoccus sp.]